MRSWREHAIKYSLMAAGSTSVIIVALIFAFLMKESAPFAAPDRHIIIVVNPANPVGELAFEDVERLFRGSVTDWREMGGPALPVKIVSRKSFDGAHGYFRSVVLGALSLPAGARELETDEEIIGAVASDPAAVGEVSRFYFGRAGGAVKRAAVVSDTRGLARLVDTDWLPVPGREGEERYGIIPLVTGSVLVTLLATLIAIPFGVAGAVYMSEVAGLKEREILKPVVEVIAGIPSVVLGFFGLTVMVPLVQRVFRLHHGLTAFSGALMLAFMAVPTIMSLSEDAIRSVPKTYREASLALGASRLETMWRVTVPAALSGIIAAVMLGMGRVIGETMAVIMVTGNAPLIHASPFRPVLTMTATIAGEMGEVAQGDTHYRALFCIGMTLLAMTFALNLVAQRVLRKHGMG